MTNGPKFPYKNECDFCGTCRAGIFAELRDEDIVSSQPIFYNPVVSTHIEAKATSFSTVVISSSSAAIPANNIYDGVGVEKRKEPGQKQPVRTETDFGERLRAGMASRNEALQQTDITAKTAEAMAQYHARIHSNGRSSMVGVTSQASVQMPKNNGSMAPPLLGFGGPIQAAKQLQSFAAQAKGSAPTQLLKTKEVKKSRHLFLPHYLQD